MKVLLVFYSRTGRTKAVARQIAEITGGEVEEIRDISDRSGLLGYIRSGLDGKTRRHSTIQEPRNDPRRYDLLIVGTPIWAGNISSPMRTYLKRFSSGLPPVAVVCTTGGTQTEMIESDLEMIIGKKPVGSICVREEETGDKRTMVNLRIFLEGTLEKVASGDEEGISP